MKPTTPGPSGGCGAPINQPEPINMGNSACVAAKESLVHDSFGHRRQICMASRPWRPNAEEACRQVWQTFKKPAQFPESGLESHSSWKDCSEKSRNRVGTPDSPIGSSSHWSGLGSQARCFADIAVIGVQH